MNRTEAIWSAAYWAAEDTRAGADGSRAASRRAASRPVLAITEFPLLRALAPALATYDGAAELDRGLDLLLPGLTATPTHHRYPTD